MEGKGGGGRQGERVVEKVGEGGPMGDREEGKESRRASGRV